MPMKATTVRFSDDLWGLLEQEAARAGVSAAQFVRDSAVLRIAYLMGRRGDAGLDATLERLGAGAGDAGSAGQVSADVLAAVRDPDRLGALRATGLLGSPIQETFDRQARIAAEALDAPVALVSLVDENDQFFVSCLGLPEPWQTRRGTPLSHSFCQHVVAAREPLLVEDARDHPELKSNLAIRDLDVIAYAGIPLVDEDGFVLGTLCAIDHKPRKWTRRDVDLLRDIAGGVVREIALARAAATAGSGNGSAAV
jgi:GAF domain-containing protein